MTANGKKIRLSFDLDELRKLYVALGANLGILRAAGEISDQRASEIAASTLPIYELQDKILSAINSNSDMERKP